jgi:hypothetical protein
MLPPLHATILTDAMVIKAAHDLNCWNALRKSFDLHSVRICVEEATRLNASRRRLVQRTYESVAAELILGDVTDEMRMGVTLLVGHQTDLDEGERDLLAYGRSLANTAWWLCGPDNGTVRAMQTLQIFNRMVSLQTLARLAGRQFSALPHNFTERWLSNHRTQEALKSL